MQATDNPADDLVPMWCQAIEAACKEENDWHEQAETAYKVFRGQKDQHFNLFHSNIETIVPAIYNSTPVADIRRRFGDKGMVEKTIADMIERALHYCADQYDLDATLRASAYDMALAGRGVVRVRYMPKLADDGQSVVGQSVTCEHVPWQHFQRGAAKTWSDVPWIAFEHYMTREQVSELNPDFAQEAAFIHSASKLDDERKATDAPAKFRCAKVWEIWDKASRRVIFLSPDAKSEPIMVMDDPLNLEVFFPIPRPIQWVDVPGSLVPICPHAIYSRLMEDLNKVSERISKLVKQVRPRGAYIGNYPDMKSISEADDGELVPLSGIDQMMSTGGAGIDKAITWFPLEPTILAIRELVSHREMIKQQIYEITGISDILRGASKASETATAQNIKASYASQRLGKWQAEIARLARDVFRIKAEIMCTTFAPETWMEITNIKLMTSAQKQQVQMLEQQNPQAAQQLAQQNPNMLEAFKRPSIEDIMQILKSDARRNYKIDIETDSTVRSDVQRFQAQSAEFLQGTTAYIQTMGPLVQQGALPATAAIDIFMSFARQFKLGKSIEDSLEQLRAQAEKAGPEMMQRAGGGDAKDDNSEADKAKAGAEQAKAQVAQQRLALDAQKAQAELALKGQQLQLNKYEIDGKLQLDAQKAQMQQLARMNRPVSL